MIPHIRHLTSTVRALSLPEERIVGVHINLEKTTVSLSFTKEEDAAAFGASLGSGVSASKVEMAETAYYFAELTYRKRVYNFFIYFDPSALSAIENTFGASRAN